VEGGKYVHGQGNRNLNWQGEPPSTPSVPSPSPSSISDQQRRIPPSFNPYECAGRLPGLTDAYSARWGMAGMAHGGTLVPLRGMGHCRGAEGRGRGPKVVVGGPKVVVLKWGCGGGTERGGRRPPSPFPAVPSPNNMQESVRLNVLSALLVFVFSELSGERLVAVVGRGDV
jgi:hypothetical protein